MTNKKSNWTWPLHNVFDEVFDDISKVMGAEFSESRPKVNIWETEEAYVLELAVPGFKKEDVKISLDGKSLRIVGEIPEKEEESVKNFKRREFYYTNFDRSYELPEGIDVNNIEASYENGILMINLPKVSEEEKVEKEIKIN